MLLRTDRQPQRGAVTLAAKHTGHSFGASPISVVAYFSGLKATAPSV